MFSSTRVFVSCRTHVAAHNAQAKLGAELKTQADKFGLTRSYEEATKLAAAAIEAGEKAANEAARRKQASLVAELLDVARQIFNNHLVGTQTLLRELQRERRRP